MAKRIIITATVELTTDLEAWEKHGGIEFAKNKAVEALISAVSAGNNGINCNSTFKLKNGTMKMNELPF
jgi:hypothetical protein